MPSIFEEEEKRRNTHHFMATDEAPARADL
jgi:hypothetical protein